MAINKKDFAKELQTVNENTGISLNIKETEKLVDNVLETIIELSKQDKIQFLGFGNFEVKESAARKGRNPQTGEEIEIAAKKTPKFKPAKGYKEAANQ